MWSMAFCFPKECVESVVWPGVSTEFWGWIGTRGGEGDRLKDKKLITITRITELAQWEWGVYYAQWLNGQHFKLRPMCSGFEFPHRYKFCEQSFFPRETK